MNEVVALEIPALPEFVGIARMAVAALAGVRPGLSYDRVDDLRIVVSEACTSVIEAMGSSAGSADKPGRVMLSCRDGADRLEVTIAGPPGAFDGAVGDGDTEGGAFRISLIEALVDNAEVESADGGSRLRLVLERIAAPDEDDESDDDEVEDAGAG